MGKMMMIMMGKMMIIMMIMREKVFKPVDSALSDF